MQIRLARGLFAARMLYYNFTRGLPVRVMLLHVLATFCVLLPLMCTGLPHSAYFWQGDERVAQFHLRNADERRVAQGNAFIGSLKSKRWEYKTEDSHAAEGPRVAVAVLAVDRNNRKIDAYQPHYLTQTLHTLLASADRDRRLYGGRFAALDIAVCNVDPQANNFAEAKRWGQVIPVLTRSQPMILPVPAGPNTHRRRCQPKSDWSWCLRALANAYQKAEWLAVIEDDQLARVDAVSGLYDLLETKLTRRFGKEHRQDRLGLVHLHSPAAKLRYSLRDPSTWLELLLIGGGLALACFVLYYRMFCNPIFLMPNLTLLAYLGAYSIAVVLTVGRPNWLAVRHALTRMYSLDEPLTEAFSATLLSRHSADWLEQQGFLAANESADSLPDKCWSGEQAAAALRQAGRRVLAIYPSLVRHVGLYSTHSVGLLPPHLLD